MLFLTGATQSRRLVALLQDRGWGRMWTRDRPNPYPHEPWGFDNGAFGHWRRGEPFNETAFLRRLERAYAVGKPYLAVAPDLVAQGPRSLDFSLAWLERLPPDWPWYLAVQDGMCRKDVAAVLYRFTGIFLGGTTFFKSTAYHWQQLAAGQGERFHYGRAGTAKRLAHALEVGADSADGTGPLWEREKMDAFLRAWAVRQGRLLGPAEYAVDPEAFVGEGNS